jgi:transcriptional regulator with XRE-family HTH domain
VTESNIRSQLDGLRALRKASDIRQFEIAQRIGRSVSWVCCVELGYKRITADNIFQYRIALEAAIHSRQAERSERARRGAEADARLDERDRQNAVR